MVDFTEALNVKVDDIEKPPLPPIGHFVFKVNKPASFDVIAQGRFEKVTFMMQGVEASDDVDPDDLSAVGGPKGVNLSKQFLFNKGDTDEDKAGAERTLYNMRNFLEKHLEIDTSGMTLKEAIDASVGMQCLGEVKHRPNPEDAENPFAEIGRTAPVGD